MSYTQVPNSMVKNPNSEADKHSVTREFVRFILESKGSLSCKQEQPRAPILSHMTDFISFHTLSLILVLILLYSSISTQVFQVSCFLYFFQHISIFQELLTSFMPDTQAYLFTQSGVNFLSAPHQTAAEWLPLLLCIMVILGQHLGFATTSGVWECCHTRQWSPVIF